MVSIDELYAGVQVKIVNKFTAGCYAVDEMEEYLDKIVTVRTIGRKHMGAEEGEEPFFYIEEDEGEWMWFLPAVEYVIIDDFNDDTSISESSVLSLIFD